MNSSSGGREPFAASGGTPQYTTFTYDALGRVVAVAVRVDAEETNRQIHERRAQAETSRRALEIERGITGIFEAIENGMYQPAMKARMSELEQQKAEIERASCRGSGRSAGHAPEYR